MINMTITTNETLARPDTGMATISGDAYALDTWDSMTSDTLDGMASDTSDGMATELYGEAYAVGDETLTWVDVVSSTVDHGEVAMATGEVTVTAAATGEGAYASAVSGIMVEGADIVIIKTKSKSGSNENGSYDASITKFKAIDIEHKPDGTMKVIYNNKETYDADATIDASGNIAIATFDTEVSGETTFASVDASVLVMDDELSHSTVVVASAVG
jgi:hypothetical protein